MPELPTARYALRDISYEIIKMQKKKISAGPLGFPDIFPAPYSRQAQQFKPDAARLTIPLKMYTPAMINIVAMMPIFS